MMAWTGAGSGRGELALAWPEEDVPLPALSELEAMAAEQAVLGLSTGQQVMALYRPRLVRQGILDSRDLAGQANGRRVRVAGLVVVHQAPPTAKGFHFITLEDEAGLIDIIVRPRIYARYRRLLHTAALLIVEGTVQQENGGVNVLAWRMEALPR